jgi:hypothetical protein
MRSDAGLRRTSRRNETLCSSEDSQLARSWSLSLSETDFPEPRCSASPRGACLPPRPLVPVRRPDRASAEPGIAKPYLDVRGAHRAGALCRITVHSPVDRRSRPRWSCACCPDSGRATKVSLPSVAPSRGLAATLEAGRSTCADRPSSPHHRAKARWIRPDFPVHTEVSAGKLPS